MQPLCRCHGCDLKFTFICLSKQINNIMLIYITGTQSTYDSLALSIISFCMIVIVSGAIVAIIIWLIRKGKLIHKSEFYEIILPLYLMYECVLTFLAAFDK